MDADETQPPPPAATHDPIDDHVSINGRAPKDGYLAWSSPSCFAGRNRVGLRAYLPDGRPAYVSRHTHDKFHATEPDQVHDALTFADALELRKWASEQKVDARRNLVRFHPCPVRVDDGGKFHNGDRMVLESALAEGLADAEARERSEAEAARKRAARAGKAVAADV